MNRIEKLKSLIYNLDSKYPKNDYIKYIGTGNPNANILIIGKEVSIDPNDTQKNVDNEIINNFKNWKEKIDYNQKNVPIFFECNIYDPLYPYKGQKFKIDNEEKEGLAEPGIHTKSLLTTF